MTVERIKKKKKKTKKKFGMTDDSSTPSSGRIRDDLLKPFVTTMSASKLLRPAPLTRRLMAGGVFLLLVTIFTGVAGNYALVAVAQLLYTTDLGDALAFKSLRAFVRTAAIETSDPLASEAFIGYLFLELLPPTSAIVLVTLSVVLVLLLLVVLFSEQVAKSLTGIVIVQHFNHSGLHDHHDDEDIDFNEIPPRIIPAWRRQLALLSRAPFAIIDWTRIALGAPYRWGDLRINGYLEVCVPLDEWAHPFMRRALRRLYNDAHSGRFMPKSGRVRSIIAGVIVACVLAGTPSSDDAITALTCGGHHHMPMTLGADIAPGERVRSLSALLDASEFVRDNILIDERNKLRAVRRNDDTALPRVYTSVRGQSLQLDVDKQLWDRTGLWYGAELMTPFGSACVVGIDAVNQLWVAHDVHIMTRSPVQLLSYGIFESVSALVRYGVHVLEDPALLGAAAAGATATPKAVAATPTDQLVDVQIEAGEFDASTAIGQLMQGALERFRNGDSVNEVINDLLRENEDIRVVTVDADGQQVEHQAAAEEDDDEDETRPRVQIEIE
jgi:hypothetical protein